MQRSTTTIGETFAMGKVPLRGRQIRLVYFPTLPFKFYLLAFLIYTKETRIIKTTAAIEAQSFSRLHILVRCELQDRSGTRVARPSLFLFLL